MILIQKEQNILLLLSIFLPIFINNKQNLKKFGKYLRKYLAVSNILPMFAPSKYRHLLGRGGDFFCSFFLTFQPKMGHFAKKWLLFAFKKRKNSYLCTRSSYSKGETKL